MTASHPRRKAVYSGAIATAMILLAACGSKPTVALTYTSSHCDAGASCTTSPVTSGDVTLVVAADSSQSSQTVTAELAADQKLHCPTGTPGGATAIFSSTAPDAAKTVTVTISGTDGSAMSAAHRAHPQYLACFGSPRSFTGYGEGGRGRAAFVSGDGLYEAALLPCGSVDTKPCFEYSEAGTTVTLTVKAAAGDPKVTP